jgi:hypothetical protein
MKFKMFGLIWDLKPVLRSVWVANGAAVFFLFFRLAFEVAEVFISLIFVLLWIGISIAFKAKGLF